MTSPNESIYQRLLRWYPRWWRDSHGPVVLATLLDLDDARGRTGPTPSEAWALRLDGIRHRLLRRPAASRTEGQTSATTARRTWTRATAVVGAAAVMTLAVGGWAAVRAQEGRLGDTGRTLDVLLRDASDYEREILSDGVVTTAEYEQALLDWRDCVTAAGAQPSEIYAIGDNELTFDYEITAASDDARVQLEVEAEACLPEYFNAVGIWWVEQDPRPTPHIALTSGTK